MKIFKHKLHNTNNRKYHRPLLFFRLVLVWFTKPIPIPIPQLKNLGVIGLRFLALCDVSTCILTQYTDYLLVKQAIAIPVILCAQLFSVSCSMLVWFSTFMDRPSSNQILLFRFQWFKFRIQKRSIFPTTISGISFFHLILFQLLCIVVDRQFL